MFRQPIARLKQSASPLLSRNALRTRTTKASQPLKARPVQKPFWTSSKVLLCAAVTGTVAYYYGANGSVAKGQISGGKLLGPQYATKKEMEKASQKKR